MRAISEALIINNANIISYSTEIDKGCIVIENGIITDISEECPLQLDFSDFSYIDLQGKTLLPAFIDAHAHLFSMAKRHDWLDLSKISSLNELIRAINEISNRVEPDKWILGMRWDESKWIDEKRYPTRKDLDEAAPDNPVLIRRIDGHLGVANTKALECLKIPGDMKGAVKDANGKLTGILKEEALEYAVKKIRYDIFSLGVGLIKVAKKAWENGVSLSHETLSVEDLTVLTYLLGYGIKIGIDFHSFILDEYIDYIIERGLHKLKRIGNVRLAGIKLFTDGSIGARTAALREPYSDDPSNRGMLLKNKDELVEIFRKADQADLQLAVHAIGDRAIDTVLDAFKEAKIKSENRHRIEHFEVVHDEHINAVKKLGIVLSMQPNFIAQWQMPGGMYERRLGKDRWKLMNPIGKIMRNQIIVAFGSDCMPFGPLYGIWGAVNHPIEENRISIMDAIKAYTFNSAYAAHMEDVAGDINTGYVGNLIALSGNIDDENGIRNAKVVLLVKDGVIRYNLL